MYLYNILYVLIYTKCIVIIFKALSTPQALAEQYIFKYAADLPLAVFRPSIIGAGWKEPIAVSKNPKMATPMSIFGQNHVMTTV